MRRFRLVTARIDWDGFADRDSAALIHFFGREILRQLKRRVCRSFRVEGLSESFVFSRQGGVGAPLLSARTNVRLKPDLLLRTDRNESGRIGALTGGKPATEKVFQIYTTGAV
jgi:hypothetical protein